MGDLSELAKNPHRPGICKSCGTDRYTVFELNVSHGQAGRCYACFDKIRQHLKDTDNANR